MRRFALAAVAATLLATPAAFAQDKLNTGWYGTLSGAYVQPQDSDANNGLTLEYDNGYAIYAAGGYRFPNNFRAEAELGYGNTDLDKVTGRGGSANLNGDVDTFTATGAVFYDYATGTRYTPYAGVGAGIAHQKLSRVRATINGATLTADGDSSTDLTAFGEAGVSIKIADKFDLVPAYRYQWINDGQDGLDDTTAHVFKVGLRYWFN